jgi:perosamine synthetase
MDKLAIYGGSKSIKKKFDLGATYFEEELNAVCEVIHSNTISGFVANSGPKFYGGEKVKELENQFRKYFNSKYAIASNSATSSLHSAFVAMGIGQGDEVIVPAVSMSASASSIMAAGGIPVFIDINNGSCPDCHCEAVDNDRGCFNINVDEIENKITKNTKALLIVHLFGKAADMDKVMLLAEKYQLKVIEDCAQSPGTYYNKRLVGTIGDVGVFSFNQSKTISAGEGGVAITNNNIYALRMQLMRNHGEAMVESFPEAQLPNLIGFNYRITELEAAVAAEQFKRLDQFNKRKIELANHLTEKLKSIDGLTTINTIYNNDNVLFIYPIIFNVEYFDTDRSWFVKACNAEGVPMTEGYTTPLIELPLFNKFINSIKDFPVAVDLQNKSLISLKICHHYNVSLKDIDNIGNAIIKVINAIKLIK